MIITTIGVFMFEYLPGKIIDFLWSICMRTDWTKEHKTEFLSWIKNKKFKSIILREYLQLSKKFETGSPEEKDFAFRRFCRANIIMFFNSKNISLKKSEEIKYKKHQKIYNNQEYIRVEKIGYSIETKIFYKFNIKSEKFEIVNYVINYENILDDLNKLVDYAREKSANLDIDIEKRKEYITKDSENKLIINFNKIKNSIKLFESCTLNKLQEN